MIRARLNEEPCICTHDYGSHKFNTGEVCGQKYTSGCGCNKFKLDNLQLIENLARNKRIWYD